jgi:hypothetical protein
MTRQVSGGFVPQFNEADLARARKAGRAGRVSRLHATEARYLPDSDAVEIVLESGVRVAWPRKRIEEFAGVPPERMGGVRLSPRGAALELEEADVDIDIQGLVMSLMSAPEMAAALARHGRRTTSESQAAAARANGKGGGRPRKGVGHKEATPA